MRGAAPAPPLAAGRAEPAVEPPPERSGPGVGCLRPGAVGAGALPGRVNPGPGGGRRVEQPPCGPGPAQPPALRFPSPRWRRRAGRRAGCGHGCSAPYVPPAAGRSRPGPGGLCRCRPAVSQPVRRPACRPGGERGGRAAGAAVQVLLGMSACGMLVPGPASL